MTANEFKKKKKKLFLFFIPIAVYYYFSLKKYIINRQGEKSIFASKIRRTRKGREARNSKTLIKAFCALSFSKLFEAK